MIVKSVYGYELFWIKYLEPSFNNAHNKLK